MKTAKTKPKDALPRWDLSDLVSDPRQIPQKLGTCAAEAKAFKKKYEGKLEKLSPAAFGQAIADYERLSAKIGRVGGYAHLDRETKLDDPKAGQLYQTVMERATDISTDTLFFTLEINKIPDAVLKKKLSDKTARRYKPWLDAVRAFRPHQLSDDIEKTLHERDVTGHAAWVRLYDETCARLRFDVRGKSLTLADTLHLMMSRDGDRRKAAALALEKGLEENIQTFSLILNTIAKEGDIDDRQRKFKSPIASRNLENQVEDEVVEALAHAVRSEYKNLAHRYYKLKAKWLGVKKLDHWDRNAPLPFAADRKIPWREAKQDVLAAYGGFHPDMERIAAKFFDGNWIDAAPRAGKDSGAFSASTVPEVHPYILMNYRGTVDDVMTLAHELGHGIHQTLAAPQGHLMCDTPLTLAETASVFGEMLAFRSFLKRETNPKTRAAVIAEKVEDMLNTVVRQIAFHTFETGVHAARKEGELTPDQIGEIWMKAMQESLGPAFSFTPGYRHFWTYVSHFYQSPFYVYAYAFGDCLVNALYAVYQDSEKGFADKYLELLKAGGTKRYDALLAPFGLDARDKRFWKKGLSVISGLIDELEEYGP